MYKYLIKGAISVIKTENNASHNFKDKIEAQLRENKKSFKSNLVQLQSFIYQF